MAGRVICYTDGSASVAGKLAGVGGFAAYFPDLFGKKTAFTAGFKNAKVGQMEVLALLYAIRAIPKKPNESVILTVYSDSEYVVKSFTENRLEKWRAAGWTNTSGEVKNKDLWVKICNELESRPKLVFEIKHIRSHQVEKEKDHIKKEALKKDPNIIGNMIADKLSDYKRHLVLLDKVE